MRRSGTWSRGLPALLLVAVGLAVSAGCTEEGLTGVEGEEPPGQAADAVSVSLPVDQLPMWRDTTYSGFATIDGSPFLLIADQPPLESRSLIEIGNVPDYVTHVEIPRNRLREYNLTLGGVADLIAQSSEDVPAGAVEPVVQECGAADVPFAVVVASGFADARTGVLDLLDATAQGHDFTEEAYATLNVSAPRDDPDHVTLQLELDNTQLEHLPAHADSVTLSAEQARTLAGELEEYAAKVEAAREEYRSRT